MLRMTIRCAVMCLVLGPGAALSGTSASAQSRDYDPLVARSARIETLELVVNDLRRQRDIPLKVYRPVGRSGAPVVLFSHGLGGSRDGNAFMGEHWARRGYVAVFPQHAGSDEGVWRDVVPAERMRALRAAASLPNTLARFGDIPAVIDQLEIWTKSVGHPLHGALDPDRIGMSGHSFGALTTQAVSGQRDRNGRQTFTDRRIKAATAFSPDIPHHGGDVKAAFAGVAVPWLVMTGTLDTAAVGQATVASRLAVFPALPAGRKYELVLHRAEHSAFTERALPGDREPRNPNHHRAIVALSTAFWDAYLLDDAAARTWLDGSGPGAVLEKDDRWQKK